MIKKIYRFIEVRSQNQLKELKAKVGQCRMQLVAKQGFHLSSKLIYYEKLTLAKTTCEFQQQQFISEPKSSTCCSSQVTEKF